MVVNTPYDDVFKTLLVDCKDLILPLINEVFGEHYTGCEKISFRPNEHFLNRQNGEESERITDTFFKIFSKEVKSYHFECQSTEDSTMVIRMFEYDAQIALDNGNLSGSTLNVTFPHSAVLYLRSSVNTPDQMHVHMTTPGGKLTYPIQILKLKNYTLDDIFDKHLFFLIPFYIFVHESRFQVYNENEQERIRLFKEFELINRRLDELAQAGIINEYFKCTIIDMTKKVVQNIAKKYDMVQKGVNSIMGGKVLEYEAKDILRKGISQGIAQGQFQALADLVRDGLLSISKAAERLNISVEDFEKKLKEYSN